MWRSSVTMEIAAPPERVSTSTSTSAVCRSGRGSRGSRERTEPSIPSSGRDVERRLRRIIS
jgi:hypothetical protein